MCRVGEVFVATYDEVAAICRRENAGRKRGDRLTVLPVTRNGVDADADSEFEDHGFEKRNFPCPPVQG